MVDWISECLAGWPPGRQGLPNIWRRLSSYALASALSCISCSTSSRGIPCSTRGRQNRRHRISAAAGGTAAGGITSNPPASPPASRPAGQPPLQLGAPQPRPPTCCISFTALVPSLSALKMRCCDWVDSMFNSCAQVIGRREGGEGGRCREASEGAAAWAGGRQHQDLLSVPF